MNKNKKSNSVFNNYQQGSKHNTTPKKGYMGPFMNEFGENIYDEVGRDDLELYTKSKTVDTTKQNNQNVESKKEKSTSKKH